MLSLTFPSTIYPSWPQTWEAFLRMLRSHHPEDQTTGPFPLRRYARLLSGEGACFRRWNLLSMKSDQFDSSTAWIRSTRTWNRNPFLLLRYASRDQEAYSTSGLTLLAHLRKSERDRLQVCDRCNSGNCSSRQA